MHDLLTDKVSWIGKNEERVNDISASVQGNKIIIDNVSLKLEEGDEIRRMLPNGIEEVFLILNLKYYLGGELFKDLAHVSIDVRKKTQLDVNKTHQQFHIYGNNSQMNVNSPNSTITMINITENNLFEKLRLLVNEQIADDDDKSDLLSQVDELEKTKDKKSFSEHYINFIASAANHATLLTALSSFIPVFMNIMHELK